VAEYQRVEDRLAEQIKPLLQEVARIEKPYREKQREQQVQDALKKFPPDIQEAIKTPEAKRTPGQTLLVAQVLIGADDVNPDDVKVDVHASAKAKARAKADQVFGVTEYRQRALKLSDADEAKRAALEAKIQQLEDKLPPPPVADGVRDGDYRLSPDGLGDSHIPGPADPPTT
jgi:hypothetical protein